MIGKSKQGRPTCTEPSCTSRPNYMEGGVRGKCRRHGGYPKCDEPGCTTPTNYNEGGIHGKCGIHGGKPTCSEPECTAPTNYSEGGIRGKCRRHGGYPLCNETGCTTPTNYYEGGIHGKCGIHGGKPTCTEPECTALTSYTEGGIHGKCARHGGYPLCNEPDCTAHVKYNEGGIHGKCKSHGGYPQCSESNCTSLTAYREGGIRGRCGIHGGEPVCGHKGCQHLFEEHMGLRYRRCERYEVVQKLFKPQTKVSVKLTSLLPTLCTPEKGAYKLVTHICDNDTANLKWGEYGKHANAGFEQVNKLCVDNFLLSVLFDDSYYDKSTNQFTNVGLVNMAIKLWCTRHGITVDCVTATRITGVDMTSADPRMCSMIQKYQKRHSRQPRLKYRVQTFKISVPNADLSSVFKALHTKLHELDDVFFEDIDLMGDFACCVTEGVLTHIAKTHRILSKDNPDDKKLCNEYLESYRTGHDTPQMCIYLVSNEQNVGKNCYTFLLCRNGHQMRMKIYNKFVQTIESPSVNGKWGTHLHDWVNNKGNQLYNAIINPQTQERGLSRIEITFYRNIPVYDTLGEYMQSARNLLLPGCNYTPIRDQWRQIDKIINETNFVYDCHTGDLSLAHWKCKTTGKVNGWTNTNHKSLVDFHELMQYSSFHGVPIKLWLLDYRVSMLSVDGKSRDVLDNYNGFNFSQVPLHKRSQNLVVAKHIDDIDEKDRGRIRYSDFTVNLMVFKRTGEFDGTMLTPSGNPRYVLRSDRKKLPVLTPLEVGFVDLSHFKMGLNVDRVSNIGADSLVQPVPSQCMDHLTALDRLVNGNDKRNLKRRENSRKKRKVCLETKENAEDERVDAFKKRCLENPHEELHTARIQQFVSDNKPKCINSTKLSNGDYTVIVKKKIKFRNTHHIALLLLEVHTGPFYAPIECESALALLECPFKLTKIGEKKNYHGKIQARVKFDGFSSVIPGG
jgi:hypothetical protein